MNKGSISQRIQFQAEFESKVWQLMSHVKRGGTLPDREQYQRVMKVLEQRAQFITANPDNTPEHESDWLALALFAKDRRLFAELCLQAEAANDPTYQSAAPWIAHFIDKALDEHGAY